LGVLFWVPSFLLFLAAYFMAIGLRKTLFRFSQLVFFRQACVFFLVVFARRQFLEDTLFLFILNTLGLFFLRLFFFSFLFRARQSF